VSLTDTEDCDDVSYLRRVSTCANPMDDIKPKTVKELRRIFYPRYRPASQASLQYHTDSGCNNNHNIWDSIGEKHDWDLVFVDNHPMDIRNNIVERLLKKTKVLIIHDTEDCHDNKNYVLPQLFLPSNSSQWKGHSCFVDISDKVLIPLTDNVRKQVWTTLIRGDLDQDGAVFDSIVEAFKDNLDEANAGYKHYNVDNAAYGTHARLLLVAAMMTHGDILELGMGDYSTQMMHDVIEDDNKIEKRLLVSAESDQEWMRGFTKLSSPIHQIIYVHKCEERKDNEI